MSTEAAAVLEFNIQEQVDELIGEPDVPPWLGDFQFVLSPSPRNIRSLEILSRLERHGLRDSASLKFETTYGHPVPRALYGGVWLDGDKIYPILDKIDELVAAQAEQTSAESE